MGSGMLTASALVPLPPVERLVNTMLKNVFNVANADSGVGNYILLAMPGAPPRWMFDQMLNPGGEAITANPMAITKLSVGANGTVNGGVYETINYKNRHVPAIFGTSVGSPNGTRPLSDLLDNMLVFRGYGSGTDGHPTNMARQVNPLATAGSVSGNVADHSSTLFKAMQFPSLGSSSGYSSIKGSGLTVPLFRGSGVEWNYINEILSPFGKRNESFALQNVRSRYQDLISQVQAALSAAFAADREDFSSLRADQTQALEKIRSGIDGLIDSWPALYSKYTNIISWAFRDRSTPGFTANPIVPENDNGTFVTPWSLALDQGPAVASPNQDARDWTQNADISVLASSFALCEFVLTQKLTQSFELNVFPPQNLAIQVIRNNGGLLSSPQMMMSSLTYDQHNTGSLAGFHFNSCLYRGVGGAVLELIAQLKANAMFDNTVIHWTQEFGRLPRNTSDGSDHGFDAMVSCAITGRNTQGPIVLGNILRGGTKSIWPEVYSHCFGYKGLTNVGGKNIYLTPAHVTSSLAVLLNLPVNPWVNVAEPLISVSSAGVQAATTALLVDE